MSDGLPMIEYDIAASGEPFVMIDEKKVTSPLDLVSSAPFLNEADHAMTHAFLLNHLAEGYSYELINDLEAFEKAYMERYNAEDPNEERPAGTVRLHNFGIPNFSSMHQPLKIGDELVFFAVNNFMGYPYKVSVTPGEKPMYKPVDVAQ